MASSGLVFREITETAGFDTILKTPEKTRLLSNRDDKINVIHGRNLEVKDGGKRRENLYYIKILVFLTQKSE